MTGMNKTWYALYTKPRWEKKVSGLLAEKGFEVYCPMNRVRKKWSDRVKWVQEPLFKSYVFVRLSKEGLSSVRFVDGVVNFVYWLGKPAIIKEREIDIIRKFLDEHDEVEVLHSEPKANDTIMIQRGVLMNKEARVIRVLNKKVEVIIESLGCRLVAVLNKSSVEVVKKQ